MGVSISVRSTFQHVQSLISRPNILQLLNKRTVNTILSRKDSSAQVPVLVDTKRTHSTAFSPDSLSQSGDSVNDVSSAKKIHTQTPSLTNKGIKESLDDSIKSSSSSPITPSSLPTIPPGKRSANPRSGFEFIFIGYINNPSSIPENIRYWNDDNHIILRDAYPKAKSHMLILPRQRIDKVTDLSGPSGVIVVEKLVDRANWLIERLKKESPDLDFKIGFHILPSILQLHLHVISQDFCSAALKKKHHWNSFTTSFFISPEKVISILKEKGSLSLTPADIKRHEEGLKRPLKCNQCSFMPRNMPILKEHLQGHFSGKLKSKEQQSIKS